MQAVKKTHPRERRPALVSTHHGASSPTGLFRLYEELYVRWALPRFQAVLCVCSPDRKRLERRGVPASILHTHLNGVDRPLVEMANRSATQREIRQSWKKLDPTLPDDCLIIGVVARLSGEKRHDRILRAFAAAKRIGTSKPCILLNFGVGGEEANLKKLTNDYGLTQEVRWLGYSKTIGSEMAGFDLLVCLSDGEGIPINLIEAGWSGTPVLSTSVGGIPDLLNEEVAYLVTRETADSAIGEKMARILSDREDRNARGTRFQERITNQFSSRVWLERLRAVYAPFSQTH
jgi:glycosyltransferase involved in cell wall biosynthesis